MGRTWNKVRTRNTIIKFEVISKNLDDNDKRSLVIKYVFFLAKCLNENKCLL